MTRTIKNGKFVGLPLNEDKQPELTDQRIKAWTAQLKLELGL